MTGEAMVLRGPLEKWKRGAQGDSKRCYLDILKARAFRIVPILVVGVFSSSSAS
jgi:hypothetical protein